VQDCKAASCGGGYVQDGVEMCDDGNDDETDGCNTMCLPGSCGGGVVEVGEQCDDGNRDTFDECPACQLAFCGDGFIQAGIEICDDGNLDTNDACIAPFACRPTVGVEAPNGACVTTNGNVVDAAVQVLIDRGHDVYEINAASIDTLQELSQFDVIVPTSAGANCYQVDWSQGRRVGGGQL
jgi:cysteine-rich repeat protein